MAAEEYRHEIGAGFGHDRNPVEPLEPRRHELARHGERCKAQGAISEDVFEGAAAGIEIEPGQASRRII